MALGIRRNMEFPSSSEAGPSGIYEELETDGPIPVPKGWKLFAYLLRASLAACTPIILVPSLAFRNLTVHFEMSYYFAIPLAYFVGAYTLAITLQNAPIFFGQVPKRIARRRKLIYSAAVGANIFN